MYIEKQSNADGDPCATPRSTGAYPDCSSPTRTSCVRMYMHNRWERLREVKENQYCEQAIIRMLLWYCDYDGNRTGIYDGGYE